MLLYHIRQSFLPGEITPEEAGRVGRELALRWTKGKHAFVVANHTDQKHINMHTIFNSTALDCSRKFVNLIGSSFALRRLSGRICLEHGLSVIENPKPRQGRHYGVWLGDDRQPSFKARIMRAIDSALEQKPTEFDAFLAGMEKLGIEVSHRGKALRFRAISDGLGPVQKQHTRCDTLKGEYTEQAICDHITGKRRRTVPAPGHSSFPLVDLSSPREVAPNLLIDIQARMQAGKRRRVRAVGQGVQPERNGKDAHLLTGAGPH